jgi:hypothetical protein
MVLLGHDDDVSLPAWIGVVEGQHQFVVIDHVETARIGDGDLAVEVSTGSGSS